MSQPQPGWYPDPADSSRQRYWAGDSWTAETRAVAPEPVRAPATSDPYAAYAGTVAPPGLPAYPGGPPPAYTSQLAGPTTADGVPLSGWWWRVLAMLLDGLVLGVVSSILMPLVAPHLIPGLMAWYQDAMSAALNGSMTIPSPTDPVYQIGGSFVAYQIVSLVIACLYPLLMLRFAGATVGQLICGLRVVPVDQGKAPRQLPWFNAIMRVLFLNVLIGGLSLVGSLMQFNALGSITTTPNIGLLGGLGGLTSLVGLFSWLNYLWALWDPKRQCLHDKVARTQVVRPVR